MIGAAVVAVTALAAPTAATAGRGAKVRVLVAGRAGSLVEAGPLRARSTTVKAGRRRCAVSASTPLAALRAALQGRVSFRVRDFGHCSRRRPRDSGQLFVNRIGPDTNSGNNGWFYKVGNRAGTAGAGDPTGPFGSGRIHSGRDVIWFYCGFDDLAASCQRNLVVRAAGVPHVGPMVLSVRGYDNEGRGVPVGGATVELGQARATTAADGRVTIAIGAPGRYRLRAGKPGLVPSFTETLVVP